MQVLVHTRACIFEQLLRWTFYVLQWTLINTRKTAFNMGHFDTTYVLFFAALVTQYHAIFDDDQVVSS